jgi:hypothetical protein
VTFENGENGSRWRQGSRAFFLVALCFGLLAFSFFAFNGSDLLGVLFSLPVAQSELNVTGQP